MSKFYIKEGNRTFKSKEGKHSLCVKEIIYRNSNMIQIYISKSDILREFNFDGLKKLIKDSRVLDSDKDYIDAMDFLKIAQLSNDPYLYLSSQKHIIPHTAKSSQLNLIMKAEQIFAIANDDENFKKKKKMVSRLDELALDYSHEIENYKMMPMELSAWGDKFKKFREFRRSCKEEVIVITAIKDAFYISGQRKKGLASLEKTRQYFINREYRERVPSREKEELENMFLKKEEIIEKEVAVEC